MYRFLGSALSSLLLVFCFVSLAGCPAESEFRRVWLLNQGDHAITGLYVCEDPREEEWGDNLLSAPVDAGELALVATGVLKDRTGWVWPYLEHHGLMSVCLMPGESDVYIVVAKTEDGDYRAALAGGGQSPIAARYLLH